MPSCTRRVVVEIDEEELEWAAESAKESVPQFVAMAIADAMCRDLDEGEQLRVCVAVDGERFVIVHIAGGTPEDDYREVSGVLS